MIHCTHGDLLDSQAGALVNTVNCVGVMGAGIALSFRRRYPELMGPYKRACASGTLAPGGVLPLWTTDGRLVLNVATKDHWRNPSRYERVALGLEGVISVLRQNGVRSVAVPPMGCGNGGLSWAVVRPMIAAALGARTDVEAFVYEPDLSGV